MDSIKTQFVAFIGSEYNHQYGKCNFLKENDGNRLDMLIHHQKYLIHRPKRTDDWDFKAIYRVLKCPENLKEGDSIVIEKEIPFS